MEPGAGERAEGPIRLLRATSAGRFPRRFDATDSAIASNDGPRRFIHAAVPTFFKGASAGAGRNTPLVFAL
jgi:hypothetical protein